MKFIIGFLMVYVKVLNFIVIKVFEDVLELVSCIIGRIIVSMNIGQVIYSLIMGVMCVMRELIIFGDCMWFKFVK